MASKINVQLANPGFANAGATTDIVLYDDVGPLNSWEPLIPGAFTVEGKSTMVWASHEKLVNCRGGGLASLLRLSDFDLDNLAIDQQGPGENQDSGDFPTGQCEWKITQVE